MPTFKLTISYEGTAYHGWQVQPDRPTVQGEVERALAQILQSPTQAIGSSRTDAGVHALGQLVSVVTPVDIPPERLMGGLNALLPDDIGVVACARAADGFHAIADTVSKRYRYLLYDGPGRPILSRAWCWAVPTRLDTLAMHTAAASLVGRHDFASFESRGTVRQTSVRTVLACEVRRCRPVAEGRHWQRPDTPSDEDGDFVVVEVEADGFLYNMVRTIVGTLVEVGRGRRPIAWPGEVLVARDRRLAGMTAPAAGLCLLWVQST